MATFTEIYYNGNEYKEMWFNGSKVWEKDSSGKYLQMETENKANGCSVTSRDLDDNEDYTYVKFSSVIYYSGYGYFAPYGTTLPTSQDWYLMEGEIYLENGSTTTSKLAYFANNGNYMLPVIPKEGIWYNFKACVQNYTEESRMRLNANYSYGVTIYFRFTKFEKTTSNNSFYFNIEEKPVPITSIALKSTLTDTSILKGTQFTITPTIMPTDYSGDELVITYDENYLSMVDNTFTVLDTATIGQQLDITYSSKNNPSVSATYSVSIRDFATIESIVLQHTLESLVIEPNTTFTITPIITPTVHDDELMIEFDNTYITNDNGTFTITNAPFSEQLSIRYYSKLNPTVSATLDLTVREFIPITSIVLTHTLESLTDVDVYTTFTVVPTVEPTVYDDELLVDYDTNYLSKDGDNYTVLGGASEQTVQVIYYSKHDNNVNAMLEFTVAEAIFEYPYPDVDSVITFRNTLTNSKSITFEVIDSTLPYSINGTSTKSFTFPSSSETQLKFVNLKPCTKTSSVIPINIEQLRIPNLTDLSYLFYCFCKDSNYTFSWSPQYFEFNENPTSMNYMFQQCEYLTDEMMAKFMSHLSNFNTSSVTSMYGMFRDCSSLTSVDLSNFNTSNVTNMASMFNGCSSLTSLNLSSFDTSQVTSTNSMFYGVSSLIYVNKDKWLPETYWFTGGANNVTFVLVDENGNEETVVKPMYYTGVGTKSEMSNWLSIVEKTNSENGSSYNDCFYQADYCCCISTGSKYYSGLTWITFKIEAPSTGELEMYTSFYNSTVSAYQTIYFGENTSNLTQIDSSYNGQGFLMDKKTKVTKVFVTEGKTYYMKVTFNRGQNSYNNNYIHGFSLNYNNIESISLTHDIEDINNVMSTSFTITPTINPSNYGDYDLEIIYDSTYMNIDNNKVILKDGCQGQTLSITYRSKENNSISDTLTFTVSQDLEISMDAIDFTQSTAPTLPDCMTLDGQGSSYYFSHGTYTTDVYGLVPNNKGKNSSTAYTRYKFVAPKDGALTFTYRCSSESNCDYLTVHVDTSTSQPSYSSSTNRVLSTSGTTYQTTDETASVNVTSGTTYYIHIQYRKDGSDNSGYDKGCIRKIELL